MKPKLSVKKTSYLPKDTSLSTVSTPVPRMLSKDCPASEYNKPRTKVSCNTTGDLQEKKNITNCYKQIEKKQIDSQDYKKWDLSVFFEGRRRRLENFQLTVCLYTNVFSLGTRLVKNLGILLSRFCLSSSSSILCWESVTTTTNSRQIYIYSDLLLAERYMYDHSTIIYNTAVIGGFGVTLRHIKRKLLVTQ